MDVCCSATALFWEIPYVRFHFVVEAGVHFTGYMDFQFRLATIRTGITVNSVPWWNFWRTASTAGAHVQYWCSATTFYAAYVRPEDANIRFTSPLWARMHTRSAFTAHVANPNRYQVQSLLALGISGCDKSVTQSFFVEIDRNRDEESRNNYTLKHKKVSCSVCASVICWLFCLFLLRKFSLDFIIHDILSNT